MRRSVTPDFTYPRRAVTPRLTTVLSSQGVGIDARDRSSVLMRVNWVQVDLGEAAEFLWRCRHGFRVVTDVKLDDFSTCYRSGVGHADVGGEANGSSTSKVVTTGSEYAKVV